MFDLVTVVAMMGRGTYEKNHKWDRLNTRTSECEVGGSQSGSGVKEEEEKGVEW